MSPRILIVDDDRGHLTMLSTLVSSLGYRVDTAMDGQAAVDAVGQGPYDLILMDVRMAPMDGITALKKIQAVNPAIPVLIMTAYSSVDRAVAAMKLGAKDYLTKPLNFEDLKTTMAKALGHLAPKGTGTSPPRSAFDTIIGESPAMAHILETAQVAGCSHAPILITGASGTGKELFARAIHHISPRNDFPLVAVNCAALNRSLLESELFGHEKGAFTGADRSREGLFRKAHRGSLFLDEIGEMPLDMQAKLLRAVQEKEVQAVGSDRVTRVDVRIIAATNQDLGRAVEEGNFRQDLFYRLNVIQLELPSLASRTGDIPLLANFFMERHAERNRKPLKGFTPGAMDILTRYHWPGNVRELENAVERAVILCLGSYVSEKELPLNLVTATASPSPLDGPLVATGDKSLEEIESLALAATLRQTGGNKTEAARILNITRTTLNNKLKKYGLSLEEILSPKT